MEDVTLSYGTLPAVYVPHLKILPGTLTAVVGASGSGKTTLAKAIGGFDTHQLQISGSIRRAGTIGFVAQDSFGALNPLQRVDKQIALTAGSVAYAHELLSAVKLDPQLHSRYPLQLSGGQRQRAAIAFALGVSPNLLLADEITSALDPIATSEIVYTLRDVVAASQKTTNPMSVLFITHDLAAARALCPSVITMHPAESGTGYVAQFESEWQ